METKLKITSGEWIRKDGTILNSNHDSKKGNIDEIAKCYCGFNVAETGEEAINNAILIADAGNTYQKCGLLPSELSEKLEMFIGGFKDSGDQYLQLAKLTETLLQQRDELLEVTRWYSNFILTANDGGDAWCAVRNQKGSTEWVEKLKEVMGKYK